MRAVPCFEAGDGARFSGDDARERCMDHEAEMDEREMLVRFLRRRGPKNAPEMLEGILRDFIAFQRAEAQDTMDRLAEPPGMLHPKPGDLARAESERIEFMCPEANGLTPIPMQD
jgi:hypothetical protein